MDIQIESSWSQSSPGARAGFLALSGVENPAHSPALEARKVELEAELRRQAAGQGRESLRSLPVMQAYEAYYSRFKKTYHVFLQLESVALKGRPIPSVAALVEAMFIAELKNGLLTAGHDLEAVQGAVRLAAASGEERYTLLNGREETLKPGDLFMRDDQGVISSILYGPDQRTRLTPATQRALFAVYAPPGIETETLTRHLEDLRTHVVLVSPQAAVEHLLIVGS